jgi:glutamine synthetase
MIAAVLGAALNGIEDCLSPPAPIVGNAYEKNLPQLPATWEAAIEAFAGCAQIKRIFAPELIENYLMTKRQEIHYMAELSDQEQSELYLETV